MSYNYTVLVKAWIKKNDKYLLTKRSTSEGDRGGRWALVGGKVEQVSEAHTLENALRREIKEEIGIEVDTPVMIYNDSFKIGGGKFVLGIMFLCNYKSGQARALEDTDEIRWFTLEELQNLEGKDELLKSAVSKLEDR